jgi:SAM-dependent methyltransferase
VHVTEARRRAYHVKGRVGDLVRPNRRALARTRWGLARHYLRGVGIEIGALDKPLRLPRSASVGYVDRMAVPDLREHYPELTRAPLVDVDIVDDGERLGSVANESVDFVIANHFYEHCEDPIGTLAHHARVTRPGGRLFIAIPDKRFTFDVERPVTPLEHVIRDHDDGPGWSRSDHYDEWAHEVSRILNNIPDDLLETEARTLQDTGYSIHFHVWTPVAWLQLVSYCACERGVPVEVLAAQQNGHEFITVLARV